MSKLNRETVQALWRLCQGFLTFGASQTLLVPSQPIPRVGAGDDFPGCKRPQAALDEARESSRKEPMCLWRYAVIS